MDLHVSKINFVETEFLKGVLHRVENSRVIEQWVHGAMA